MKLAEIFAQLRDGELSQVAMGTGEDGEIREEDYPKLVNHVNLALTALYARFNLKENRLTLALQPDILNYSLNSLFAVANTRSREEIRYIVDSSGAPFKDDILKVERVLTADDAPLALNDEADCLSIRTPSTLVLAVPSEIVDQDSTLPAWMKTATLTVVYRACHPRLSNEDVDPIQQEVDLPYPYLEPLLFFIASRVHNPIGMAQEFNSGNGYFTRYEDACLKLEGKNLQIDRGGHNTRLSRGGWV